jgi:hypothetical protein
VPRLAGLLIFRDDAERADFVARLAALAEGGALTVYVCGNCQRTLRYGVL